MKSKNFDFVQWWNSRFRYDLMRKLYYDVMTGCRTRFLISYNRTAGNYWLQYANV